jgi:hypothetical protein
MNKQSNALSERFSFLAPRNGGLVDYPEYKLNDPYNHGINAGKVYAANNGNIKNVTISRVNNNLRGMGMGQKLYGSTIRSAFEDYARGAGPRYFASDANGSTSNMAVNMYERLKNKGYPFKTPLMQRLPLGDNVSPIISKIKEMLSSGPRYKLDLARMGNFYDDGAKLLANRPSPSMLSGVTNAGSSVLNVIKSIIGRKMKLKL